MLQLRTNILDAKRQELRESLDWICIRHTFDQLMDGTDRVSTDVGTGIVKDHVEDHVVERL